MRKFARVVLSLIVAVIGLALVVAAGFRTNAWWQESETAQALAPVNGKFISTSMGSVHVSNWGEENAPTVVMTHGMAAWGGLWEETAQALQKAGYRVVAVDMPPFGFSARDDRDFSRSRQAERLKALEMALGLKDYYLVGHSYGGGIALEMALRHPENLKALVLVAPVIGLEQKNAAAVASRKPDLTDKVLGNDVVAETLVSLSITNPLATGFLTRQFMHRKDALTSRHIEILQQPMKLKGNTHEMVVWLRQFLNGDPNSISSKPSEVANAKLPVSLIWGERDRVTPISQGDRLSGVLSPVRFSRLPDVGHMPQLEAPEVFQAALIDTLQDFSSPLEQP